MEAADQPVPVAAACSTPPLLPVADWAERDRGEWLVALHLTGLAAAVVPVLNRRRVWVQEGEAAPTAATAAVVISLDRPVLLVPEVVPGEQAQPDRAA